MLESSEELVDGARNRRRARRVWRTPAWEVGRTDSSSSDSSNTSVESASERPSTEDGSVRRGDATTSRRALGVGTGAGADEGGRARTMKSSSEKTSGERRPGGGGWASDTLEMMEAERSETDQTISSSELPPGERLSKSELSSAESDDWVLWVAETSWKEETREAGGESTRLLRLLPDEAPALREAAMTAVL